MLLYVLPVGFGFPRPWKYLFLNQDRETRCRPDPKLTSNPRDREDKDFRDPIEEIDMLVKDPLRLKDNA